MIQIDIPMPKACDICPFNYDFGMCTAFGDYDNWEKYSDDWNENVCERTTRPEYCPLKEHEPVDVEIEGGGSSWWYVCEECRGAVDTSDSFCRHCGRPFRKKKVRI